MKKFIPILSLLLGLFILFTSCKDNRGQEPINGQNPTQSVDPNDPHAKPEKIYIRISKMKRVLRGATSDPITKINDVAFLFFEGNNPESKLKKAFFSPVVSNGLYSCSIVRNNYSLVVVANPTESYKKRMAVGTTLAQFNAPLPKFHEASVQMTQRPEGKFPEQLKLVTLVNAQGPVQVTPEHFNRHPKDALRVPLEPTVARFTVKVKPSYAKFMEPVTTKPTGGEAPVNMPMYMTLVNEELSGYPMRQMGLLATGVQEVAGDNSELRSRYALSPSYLPFESDFDIATYENYRMTYYSLKVWHKVFESLDRQRAKGHYYICETTVSPKNLQRRAVPHMVILIDVKPKGLELEPGEGWIDYKGHYLRGNTFLTYLNAIIKNTKKPEAPQGFPADFIDACKVFAKSPEAEFARIKDGLKSEKHVGCTVAGIKYYAKSHNYYFLPVRHFGDAEAPDIDSYGRYGVVRNNEYKFSLTKINDFGAPSLYYGFADSDQKLQEVEVEITVNPIVERDEQEFDT